MKRVKEFINNKLSELKFKGKYLEELFADYDLYTTGLTTERDKLETEMLAYQNILDFIDILPIEEKSKYNIKPDEERLIYKDTNEIGWKCYVARHKLKETQGAFAKRFGVDTTAVSKWELGKVNPNMKHYSKIEELFEMVKGE